MVKVLLRSFLKRQMFQIPIIGVMLQQENVLLSYRINDMSDDGCLSRATSSGYADNKGFQKILSCFKLLSFFRLNFVISNGTEDG